MIDGNQFTFKISLSVLNHLGKNLYRSFATVLGEAISNAWDADAKNVWITIDKKGNGFVIKDDGIGMDAADFQGKFLKIGYSKRKAGTSESKKGRPFIGRKGIGKLALLSCAERITVISKKEHGTVVGGIIDNPELDEAIIDDLEPSEYSLENFEVSSAKARIRDIPHGTVIQFDGLKSGIKNSFELLRKVIALYFRFSLLDNKFNIYLDGKKVSFDDLDDLAGATQFAWNINGTEDPYLLKKLKKLKEPIKDLKVKGKVTGFVASVAKPRDLKIMNMNERVTIDLFVNGRVREMDILKHIPTSRVAENYLYGQIHFNGLDDDEDRFTSSREGVVANDPKYEDFLKNFDSKLNQILEDWDIWRIKHREPGDSENPRLTPRDRTSLGLFNAVSGDFGLSSNSKNKDKVDDWVTGLADDATYNFGSYAECFVSENLVRKLIQEKKTKLSDVAIEQAAKWREREKQSTGKANISIQIRREKGDLNYLDMDGLANLADKPKDREKEAALARDANEYKPMRDAVAHTALLTREAKKRLNSVSENIQARVKALLSE